MKKSLFAVISLCVCVLAFSACKQNVTDNNNNDENDISSEIQEEIPAPEYTIKTDPLTDTVSFKETGELIYSKTVERVRVTAHHDAYVDAAKKISTTMKRATDRNEEQAESIKESILNSFSGEDMTGLPWSLEAKYEAKSSGGKIVCIIEHIYYNAGGAYPVYADFAYNFDAATGKQLYLDELLPEDDDKKWEFEVLLRKKLDEKYPDTVQESFIQIAVMDMAVDTWMITDTGMTVWFNEQELAPHAAGKLEIELTRDELPEGVLQYMN